MAAAILTACVASALVGGAWERHAAASGAVPAARAEGYQQGYTQGLEEGTAERQDSYRDGYDNGYQEGSQDADAAYDEGFADAKALYKDTTTDAPQYSQPDTTVWFENCTAARVAGAAPVYRGDPGYGSHLDADGDGVGCE